MLYQDDGKNAYDQYKDWYDSIILCVIFLHKKQF